MDPSYDGSRLAAAPTLPARQVTALVPGPDGLPRLRGEVAFRLLVEAVEDYAIFLLSPEGNVLSWNLGAQRIKGYEADEIIGQHFSRFYTADEQAAGRPMQLLGWAAEHGRFEDKGWRVRRDGTRFWADVIVTALRDENGVPYAFAKITRDLTQQRASEERERALIAEREARAGAEAALIARDRFLTIAAHELKTPAASLMLMVDGLARARQTGRLDDARLAAGLQRLGTATRRLDVLINELLDVSRLQSATQEYRTERLDVVQVVRDVIDRFAEADETSRVRLIAPDVCWMVADASRLDQVVTNLVDNALKYSAPSEPIEVAVTHAGGGVSISVSDVGIGLDEAAQATLFEAFGRGTNAEHIPGLGLGLFISHQVVERHGGRIEARRREDGPGSVFRVWLPVEPEP
jgi:PAS domain S-box-containing protein